MINFIMPFIIVFGFYNFSIQIKKRYKIEQNDLIFATTLFLVLLSLVVLPIIYFNFYIKYFFNFLLLLLISFFTHFLYSYSTGILKLFKINKLILILGGGIAVLSLLPINGADSYAYHLSWPKYLIQNPEIFFNKSFLEFRVIGIGEIINYIGIYFGTENLMSFLSVVLILYYLLRKNLNYFFLFFSIPIFWKYLLDQKPFIFPSLIAVIFTIHLLNLVNERKKIKKLEIFSFFVGIFFFMNSKYPFLVHGTFILIFFFFISFKFNFLKNYLIYGFITLILIFFPISLIKIHEFGDPFTPFLEFFFNKNKEIIKLSEMYKNWDGYLYKDRENNLFSLTRNLFNFIIPTTPFTILDTFGISFFLIFLIKYLNKLTQYFVTLLFIIVLILAINTNFQARWFLPFFLFLVFFNNFESLNNKIKFSIKNIIIINFVIVYSFFSFYGISLAYSIYKKGIEKTKEERIYLYKESSDIKKIAKDSYVLTNTRNIFFFNQFIGFKYSDYSTDILKKYYSSNKIEYAYFSIGAGKQKKTYADIRKIQELKYFNRNCYKIIDYQINPVAKRNNLNSEDYEQFILIKFNVNAISCIENLFVS